MFSNDFFNTFGISADPSPASDLRSTDDGYVLEIELPGVRKEDITVSVKERVLSVKADKKPSESEVVRGTRQYGPLEVSYRVSDTLDTDAMTAKFLDGVLLLSFPQKADRASKAIPVL